MARDSRFEAGRLADALDAIEAQLGVLERNADWDVVTEGLGEAARALNAAAREAAAP